MKRRANAAPGRLASGRTETAAQGAAGWTSWIRTNEPTCHATRPERSQWGFYAGCAAALLIALCASGTFAEHEAHADPLGVIEGEILDVSAERLDVDVQRGSALLEGDVTARLGDLLVKCPKVEVRYDGSPRVRWAKGSGGVSAHLRGVDAKAAVIEVDVPRRNVELSGGVRLARGRGWVKADRATIDMTSGKVSLHSVQGEIPVVPPQR